VVDQIGYVVDALSSGRSSFVALELAFLRINDVIEPAGMQMLLANTG
jgi:LacI family transcriptional regulator, gluconate utilization system Gnt-I transcriptional repressor